MVIYNGPSRAQWLPWPYQVPVLVGCNWAYRDLPLTALVAVDRFSVAAIVKAGDLPRDVEAWTKHSNLPLPQAWHHRTTVGMDSGTMAVELALDLCEEVMVIGADGVCGGATENIYEYPWHKSQPKPHIHRKHRQGLERVRQSDPRFTMVWDQPVQGLDTQPTTWAKQRLAKYLIR